MALLKRYRFELLGALICLSLGYLSGYGSESGDSLWFRELIKPNFNPPSSVFGPVWTVLYLMMGVTIGQLWKQRDQCKTLLTIFYVQLILNLSWSPLFFYFHRIDLALINIVLLWLLLLLFMRLSFRKWIIFLLFLPYFLWVSFAVVLNASLLLLN